MTWKGVTRLLPIGGIAAAALLVSQCQVDKLVSPPTGGVLTVGPLAVADSAPLGSSAGRPQRLIVGSGASGGISWSASTAKSSAWLHLGAATGTAPDTLPLTLVPTGLALGTYRDTVVITGAGSSAGELRVPVVLTVQACSVTPITAGSQTTGSLGAASCAAPHRANHPAALYSFSGSLNDSVSIELTAPSGYLVLDSTLTAGKPSFSESGTCQTIAGNPCLYYQKLPRTGPYLIEVTTNSATDSGAYTLSLSPPRIPNAAAALTQLQSDSVSTVATGDTVSQNTMVFRGVVSDPDRPDSLRLEVEAKPTSVAFTSTGTVVGAPVANGQAALVRVSGLLDDSAYHWRARTVDQTGRVGTWLSYGGNAESAADFVLGNSVVPPANLGQFKSDGVTSLAVGATNITRTLVIKGKVSDPVLSESVRLEVELEPLGTAFANVANASSSEVASGNSVPVTSPVLIDHDGYHWQARTVTHTGRTSAWVSFGGNAETAADFVEALAPQQLVFTVQPSAVDTAGSPLHPVIQVAAQDSLGNTLTSFTGNIAVAIDSNPGGSTLSGTTTAAAVAGIASFADLSLDKTGVGYRLRATLAAPALTVKSATFNVVAGGISPSLSTVSAAPATIHASTGDSISTITVTVKDPLGNPVSGVTVTLSDTATGDSLRQPAAATNGAGVATGSVSGKLAGVKTIHASAGAQAITQAATVTVIPAHAQILVFSVQPTGASAGATLTPAVQVTARDSMGNTDTSYAGNVTVAIGSNPGSATLGGTKTIAASHGVATFSTLTLDKTGTGYTLTATAVSVANLGTSSTFNIGAGTGTRLAFTGEPSTVVAGAAIAPAVQVTAQDGSGNTVTTFTGAVTLTLGTNPGSDSLGGTVSVNAVAGVATFSNLTLDRTGAGYTLAAGATGFTAATSTAFNVRPGAAAQLAFTTEPSGASAGATLPATVVTAQDAFGNTDTSYAGTVTVAIDSNPAGGVLGGTAAVGAVHGAATFSTLTIDKAGLGYRLAATATSLTRARSNAFNVTAGAVSATLSTVTALPTSITAGGTGSAISVTARDSHGNPITGSTVVLSATGTGNTVTQPSGTTDGTGLATGSITSTKAEAKTVSATVDGVLLNQTAAVTVTPGAISAAQSTLNASPASVAAGGGSSILTATARDAFGNPVSGVTAALSATGAGNTVTQPPSPTDASGIATGALSSTVAGTKIVSVSLSGVAVTQTDTVTVTSGGPTHLVFTVEPSATTAGAAITPSIQVSARDANENVATGFTGNVTLAIVTNPGGGTLSGTATVAATSGVATFPGMRINRAGAGYTLNATASGLVTASSASFDVLTGTAAKLGMMSEPSSAATNDVALAQQPVVQIQDSVGNPVSQAGTTITAAIATGAGTLGGTLTAVTSASGFATFTDLKITGVVGARTLTFTAAPLTSATSTTVTLSAGAATQMAVNGGNNQAATAGTAVGTPPSVIVKDVSGNPVSGVAVTFTLPVSTGPDGSMTGPTQSTSASGIATVGSWTLGTNAKPDTMFATSTGLAGSPVTFVDTAKVGAPATVTKFSGDNLVGQVGTRLATPHDALVTDGNGNPVPGVAVSWVAVGGGSVDSGVSHTDANGHATMNRTLGSTPGGETTTATVASLTAVSFAVTAQVGGATQMALNGGDRQTDTVGDVLPVPLSVIVKDALNNPVSGFTVSWSVLNGGGTVSAPTSVTNASGIATMDWTLGTAMSPTDSIQSAQATGVASPITFTAFTVPGPVSAAQTSVTASSPITASTGSSQSTVTVTARDQFGNVIKNKAVTLASTGTGNTVTNPGAATNANGVAAGTLSSTKAESKTITATVGGVTITQQPIVVVDPAAAASLNYVVQPSNAAAGAAITPAIQVEILDGFANRVTAASNAVSLAIGTNAGGGTLSGTVTNVAAVTGVASFPTASLNKAGTGYTLAASATGLTGATSTAFNVTAGSVSAAQSTVVATSPITASSGTSQSTVTVTAIDANGNPVPGATVVLAATGTGNTLTQPVGTTNASGVATGTISSTVAEAKTVSATINGVAITQTAGVTVNPAAAATITASAGTGQTGAVTTTLTTPPAVIVKDAFLNPVPGVTVTFAATASNGTLTAPTAPVTGVNGVATVGGWTLGTAAKTDTVTATAGVGSVVFTAVATPGNADHLVFTQQPASAVAGAAITPAMTVTALDAQGNVATGFAGTVTLAIGTNPGGGALTGTTSIASAGVATFSATSINKTGTGYTLTAASGGVTSATSSAFNITPGTATQLAFVQQPSDAVSNTAIAPAVTVEALDVNNNIAAGFATPVSLALTTPAGAVLSGGAGTAPVSGVATFSTLSVDKVGGYTLTASATGVTGATSTTFTINPGTATKLAFTVQPSTAVAGASIAPSVQVTAQDAAGNTATGFNGSVSVAIGTNAGGSTLSGTTAITASAGMANFSNLSLDKVGTGYTLTTSSTGLAGATSTAFNISPAAASTLVFTAQPVSDTAAGPLGTIQVTARDAFGNTATAFANGVTLAIATNPGSGALSGTNTATPAAGVATFSGLSINKTGTGYTLGATATGVTGATSTAFNVTPGNATHLAFTGQPSAVVAGAAITPAVTATVLDANNNVVIAFAGSDTIRIGTNPGSSVLAGDSIAAFAAGVATHSTLNLNKAQTGYTLTDRSGLLTGATSGTFNVTAGAASASQTTVGATSPITAGGAGSTVTVTARDALGNPVAGAAVVLASTGTGNTITQPGVTNASGVTTGTLASTTAETKTVSATVNALAVTQTASVVVNPGTPTLSINLGNNQTATVDAAVTTPPSVIAKDAFNNPVSGVAVTFSATATNGTVTGGSQTTGINGIATVGGWTLGATAKPDTLTATSTAGSVTFLATATAGAATTIAAASTPPASATVGASVTAPSVLVTDTHGNPVANVNVTFTVTAGGGTISPTSPATVATDLTGHAALTSWTLGTTAGANTVTAAATGLTGSPVSFTVTGTAAAASKIVVSAGDAQSATAGTAVATAPAVLVTDASNNPVAGVTVTFAVASGGGSLTGTNPVVTGSNGIATIGSWTLGTTVGANTLTATATGFAGGGNPVTFTATGTVGAAAKIVVNAGNAQSAIAGTAVTTAPSVLVTDINNNPVTGVTVTFAVASGAGSLTGTNPTTTASNGIAAIGSWTLGTTAGANSLTATATGFSGGGNPVTFTATGTAGTAATIAAASAPPATATVATSVTAPSVLVTDSHGNPVSGVSVTFTVTGGGGAISPASPATLSTDVNGHATLTSWTLGTSAGANTVTAAATGLTGSPVTFTVTGTAGGATTIAAANTPPASATVGTSVTAPLVLVTDTHGNPVSGVGVIFAVTAGNGTISPTTAVTTDGAGHATATTWTLGTTAGTNTVTATATGLTGSPVSFSVTGTAGAVSAAQSTVTASSPITASSGASQSTITVTAKDANGNLISGATVVLAAGGTGNTLTQPAGATNGSGVATGTLSSTVAQSKSVSATIAGVAITQTATVVVDPAAANSLNFVVQPSSATAGASITPAIQVEIRDAFNNRVTTAANQVSLTIGTNAGGGTLSGTVTNVSPVSGIATFSDASLDKTGTGYTLAAGATGLTAATSSAFNITAGTATTIAAASTPPASAVAGTSVTAPSVLVTDAHGNPVANQGVTFTLTAGTGAISPASPAVLTTDGTGHATLTSWTLGTAVGTNTVTATNAGLGGSPVSFSVTGTAGAAAKITVNAGNAQSATVGTAVPTAPAVLVTDINNNPVAGVTVTFVVASGSGSLTAAAPVTGSNGIAAVGSWTLGNTAGANSLTATATGFSGGGNPVTFTATGTADAAANIAAASTPPASAVAGTSVTAPSVLVTDAHGNPVANQGVTFTLTAGTGAISPASPAVLTTDGTGHATLTSWTLGTAVGTNTVTAASTGLAGSPVSFSVTGTPGPVSAALSTVSATSPITAGGAGSTVTVTAKDANGNLISGATVVLASSGTGNSITQPGAATNGSGVATGTVASTKAETKTVSATINGVAITQTASVVVNPGAVSATQSTVTAGSPITASTGSSASTITVTAKDASGNLISGLPVVLAATGSNNTLTQPVGNTNGSGVATGTLSSTTAETKTVSATINGVAITQTASVVVNAGAATQLVFTGQPTNTAATTSITPAVVVTAEDAFGNVDQTFGGSVNLTLSGGTIGATLSGANPVTASAGVATFSNLSVDLIGTGYQLQAASGLLSSPLSNSFNITL